MRLHGSEEWAKIRSEGKGRYLLRYGVLRRVIPMGIAVAFLIELLDPSGVMPVALLAPRFLWRLLLALAVFAASSCLSALGSWRLHERRFDRLG
jgi:hypothetical protein